MPTGAYTQPTAGSEFPKGPAASKQAEVRPKLSLVESEPEPEMDLSVGITATKDLGDLVSLTLTSGSTVVKRLLSPELALTVAANLASYAHLILGVDEDFDDFGEDDEFDMPSRGGRSDPSKKN